MRAQAAGDPGPWRQQATPGRGGWDAAALCCIMRDDALETLACPDAVLVLDGTVFLKQGEASCGLGRHYTGSAVKAANCQIGVCASHLSRHGWYRHVSLAGDGRFCMSRALPPIGKGLGQNHPKRKGLGADRP